MTTDDDLPPNPPQDENELTMWLSAYDQSLPKFKDLLIEIENDLRTAIASSQLKIHTCGGRIKTRESFSLKISKKRYADPLVDMHDVVGIRVVCLFIDDLVLVDEVVRKTFDVLKYEDKTKNSAPDRFGYRSVHYDCRLPPSRSGPRYDHIKGIVFEVQVRTILQDAWAVVEHYLGYKGLTSIPNEAQADFGALVGLFHLADKTFQQIRDTARLQDNVAKSSVRAVLDLRTKGAKLPTTLTSIDRSTLKALLRSMYPTRAESLDSEYSELVEELARSNVSDISRLRDLLQDGARQLEEENSQLDDPKTKKLRDEIAFRNKLSDVRFARLCLGSAYPAFRLNRLKRLRLKN